MSEKPTNESQAQEIVKKGLVEINAKNLAKSGGKNLMDKWIDLFKKVEEQNFSIKKFAVDETIMGTVLEAQIKNSILYPDNYQMMIKAITVYKVNPYSEEVADDEMIIEERREIIFLAKSGCTSILRKLKVAEPDGGYDLPALSKDKDALKSLIKKRFSIKYCGKQEYEGKFFHSYVVQLY